MFQGSRASSIRIRSALLIAAILTLSSCTSDSTPAGGSNALPGNALDGSGNQSNGIVGNENAEVGQVWWFALPLPVNSSETDIEITSSSVLEPAKGLKVLGYGAYDLEDTEGLPLMALEGSGDAPKFDELKNHANEPVTVKGGEESEIFFAVRLKIEAPPSGTTRSCRYEYRQGQQLYRQTLNCELDLRTN
ncbi:hypothetical protein [Streptomyces anulatus]|uniref:hypothetical protein n=1 Tax=Streptomyces anulatus TaxID=1892 RepID=UPI0033CD7263